ncbi:MAG: hypothetical protein L3K23_04520 [Thermoplasmata archaeon]|nr:hypothetical protein [Thermoplasmata archaeon]
MIGRALRLALLAPAFVYPMVLLLAGIRPLSVATLALSVVIALPIVAVVRGNLLAPLVGLSGLMIGFVGLITLLTPGTPSGLGADLVVALLLGGFPWLLAVAVVLGDHPAAGLLGLSVGLLGAVSVLAALPNAWTASDSSSVFVARWYATGDQQFGHLGEALVGRGLQTATTFPYETAVTPLLVGLAIVAVAGLLLPWLQPSPVGFRSLGSAPRRDLAAPRRIVPWPSSRILPPPASAPVVGPGAGLVPVSGALIATGGFAAVALLSPANAFLAIAAGATAVVIVLLALTFSGPARRPPAPTSAPARGPAATTSVGGRGVELARPPSPP